MPGYRVKTPLEHDGARYETGAAVELTEEQAAPLLAAGAVEPLPEQEAAPKRRAG